MNKKLLIIQANEINFDLVKLYSEKFNLSNFKHILKNYNYIETSSENDYENLEPWIQWVSFYTGKSYQEHKVFFLNELKDDVDTIFKKFDEKFNARQCLMFPMNLKNNLKNDKNIFIPDPWTDTIIQCDKDLVKFYNIIKKIILNNKNINLKISEVFYLTYFIFFNSSSQFKIFFLKNIFNLLKKNYFKPILFDNLIADLFYQKIISDNYDVSSIFLNAGAHIQHHYMFNSCFVKNKINPNWYLDEKFDPVKDYLVEYDKILGKFLNLNNYNILITTGLSQSLIDKPIFYYNLKNPKSFFSKINIYPKNIIKRMSRDYTLEFNDTNIMNDSLKILNNLKINESNIFLSKIEGKKIFLELIYSGEIDNDTQIVFNNVKIKIKDDFIFLAIKNTIHNQKGYCYTNIKSFPQKINIKNFYDLLTDNKFINEI